MKKILVIKPSSFGDIIHGLQVIQSLRENIKDVEVTWVVRDIFESFVSQCSTVDRVIVFKREAGIKGFFKVVGEIRKETYDYVLDMQGLARSALMTFFAKGKYKWGRRDAREFSTLFYQKKPSLPLLGKQSHAIEILLQFLSLFDLQPKLKGCLSFPNVKPSRPLPEVLLQGKSILIFPNSRRPEKEWPHIKAFTQWLIQNYPGHPVAWVGTDLPEGGAPAASEHFYNLVGKTKLMDVIILLQSAGLVISNDSGPMHLAASMRKEVVALFGPTPPELYGPYPIEAPKHHVLRAPGKNMADLSLEAVAQAVDKILT